MTGGVGRIGVGGAAGGAGGGGVGGAAGGAGGGAGGKAGTGGGRLTPYLSRNLGLKGMRKTKHVHVCM